MKHRLGRELFWLSLPALLLGGGIFYRLKSGVPAFFVLPNPFDKSPLHLETAPFSPVELTPREVALGYDWGTQTTIRESGILNVPSGWRDDSTGGTSSPMYLIYRRNGVWKRSSRDSVSYGEGSAGIAIRARLKNVPRDADEVRLRGQFREIRLYRGPLPSGWKSPLPVTNAGFNHLFYISSKPFDVLVKGKADAWPSPQVSHQQKLEVVEGKWLVNKSTLSNELLIRFRAKTNSGISGAPRCNIDNLQYLDATGKKLTVFQDATSTAESGIQGASRQWCSPDLPENEQVVRIAQPDAQPRGGWITAKMPITVTELVSDGQCWPTPFKVKLKSQWGEMKDYGARPTPTP